jgi:prepilin-type N-terminal cleavage/methylation domain-containing protein
MLHDRTAKRIGFTLVELLVVIAIIAVLAGLATFGVFAMMGRTQARNTESTMKVVNKLLMDRWSTVIDEAKKETPSSAVLALAGGDRDRAKVIWVKVRLMEAFPAKYDEVNNPTVLNAYILPDQKFKSHFAKYQTLLKGKTGGVPGESAACLLMVLKTLSPDGVNIEDQLPYAVADTDGDGLKELVDGWGKPMHFTRFGIDAGVQAVNPALAATNSTAFKYSDPTDPGGKLLTPNWYGSANRATFDSQFHIVARPPVAGHPGPDANYVIPVIVAGPNLDIFSYKLKGD